MKKSKNVTVSIPLEDAEYSGFAPDSEVTIHAGENVLVVTPKEMTVLQAALAMRSLIEVTGHLIGGIRKTCGECGDRRPGDGCPYGPLEEPGKCPYWDAEPEVTLSDSAREELGIPKDSKLMLLPDVCEGLVCAADYDHDIADIPAQVLDALDLAGVCRGRLDEAVMNNEVIYHG